MGSSVKNYIILHLSFLLIVLSNICSKLASEYSFGSIYFIFYYGMSLFIFFIYALIWQYILKIFALTTAIFNKSIVIVWGFIVGYLLFGEKIYIKEIAGCIFIMTGIYFIGIKK